MASATCALDAEPKAANMSRSGRGQKARTRKPGTPEDFRSEPGIPKQ
jgi:hypothetical protein